MATTKQMRNRMLSGHHQALEAIARGESPFRPTMRACEVSGMRTVITTLQRWNAIVITYSEESGNKVAHFEITNQGKELL